MRRIASRCACLYTCRVGVALAAAALFVLASAPSNAQLSLGAALASPPATAANTLTGTFCSASCNFFIPPPSGGQAPVVPTPYISYFEIDIEDVTNHDVERVYTKTYSPATNTDKHTVYFDCSHFPDTDGVEAVVSVTDTTGAIHVQTSPVFTIQNSAVAFGRYEWESRPDLGWDGVAPAVDWLTQMNHGITQDITQGWTAADILDNIGLCTAFYVNTHGGYLASPQLTAFESDLDELGYPIEDVYPQQSLVPGSGPQVLEYRSAGTSEGISCVGIAVIDACYTGIYNQFADAFLYPFTTYSAVNQAEIGWSVESSVDHTDQGSNWCWQCLCQGGVSNQARDMLVRGNQDNLGLDSGACQKMASCWGDYFATLHGVYTGTEDTKWFTEWYNGGRQHALGPWYR